MRRVSNDEYNEPRSGKVVDDPEKLLHSSLLPLESAFLSRSFSRLVDPVNLMFSAPNSPPTKQECDILIRTIASEVNVSCIDASLSESVARNVLKCIQLLCTKCEQMTPADEDATQVIAPPTQGQQMVVTTVNQLLYVKGQLERTFSATLSHLSLTSTALTTLQLTLPAIEAVIRTAISPLCDSIHRSLRNIILTMHLEDFSGSSSSSQCSAYLKELQSFLSRAHADYIMPFHSSNILKEFTERLASQCLSTFVWSASLIRPLGDGGKLRLAADFAQLEEGELITSFVPK